MSDLKDPKYIAEKVREIPVELLIEFSLQSSRETINLLEKFTVLVTLKKRGDTPRSISIYNRILKNILDDHQNLMNHSDILKNLLADIEAKAWENQVIN